MRKYRMRHSGGYTLIYRPEHPCAGKLGYVYEHRLVVEEAGITIPDRYHVHHKNGVKDDNRLENLEVISPGAHVRRHAEERTGFDDAAILALFLAGTTVSEFCELGVSDNRVARVKRENGFAGVWARQRTHCKRGHEFNAENARITKRGSRECRICDRARDRARIRAAA